MKPPELRPVRRANGAACYPAAGECFHRLTGAARQSRRLVFSTFSKVGFEPGRCGPFSDSSVPDDTDASDASFDCTRSASDGASSRPGSGKRVLDTALPGMRPAICPRQYARG